MTFQDFELGEELLATYRFESNALSEADEGSLVSIDELPGTKKVMVLFKEDRHVTCEPYDNRARSVAIKLRQAGLATLVTVLTVGQQRLILQGRTFAGAVTFPIETPLEILVTERVVDQLPISARS